MLSPSFSPVPVRRWHGWLGLPAIGTALFVFASIASGARYGKFRYGPYLLNDEYRDVLARSLAFAVLVSVLALAIGLLVSFSLRSIEPRSIRGKLLALLLVPLLIGDTSAAYIFKLLLGQGSLLGNLLESGGLVIWGSLVVMQCWRFMPFCVYVIWLRIQVIDRQRLLYAELVGMKQSEILRYIILPEVKILAIAVTLLTFSGSIFEDAKLRYVFRASPGTETELISQWLGRVFLSEMVISPSMAMENLFARSVVTFAAALVFFLLLAKLCQAILKNFMSLRRRPVSGSLKRKVANISPALSVVIIAVSVLPPLYPLARAASFEVLPSAKMLSVLPQIVFCGAFAGALAVFFGLSVRLGQYKKSEFSLYEIITLIMIWCLLLVPPLAIMIMGFRWLSVLGYQSEASLRLAWTVGQGLASLPVIGSFIVVSHVRVTRQEFEFFESLGADLPDLTKVAFFRRFLPEYLFTFLVAISMVWNEAVLNRALSDVVPSFVSNLEMAMTGRAADSSMALSYYIVALLVAAACVFSWTLLQARFNIR